MEALNEIIAGMGCVCMGDDSSGAYDSPIPIDQENGSRQANTPTGRHEPASGFDSPVCGWENRVICFYPRDNWKGNYGLSPWIYPDGAVDVARTVDFFGSEVLAR